MHKLDLDAILSELAAREPIFHQREFGTSREDLLKMTANDFWEIGASGKIYGRDFVIERLLERYKSPEPDDWSCTDFLIRPLAENLFQLNYVLQQPGRQTRRTTLWRRQDGVWQIVFHQGTVVA
ncbi:hypothetical protein GGE16_005798 [Rhizobium leguminosarum]|uniref:DUF4440 domain-containing protein n=1 Tax=Rhizobium leguminosarum TaxID=384 RepID=A0AAE2MRK2_RHILE|nr:MULTISPECIES: DUF4440 domain-containing protein [Rhizobium]ARM90778.1 NTF2 domain-containing protein [Rhizobium sp. CIAT894]MBB4293704.1 hypothetical protein [Rhizobium leguminosarum]MBB4299304.1 hypothetical protein [Rhizobium leguminosarum]MBB4310803.1 hypothetical protein [Rhizobium leguminosarum]MBB4420085.1 hypothetical protein [Rhizobium leguminosarum]